MQTIRSTVAEMVTSCSVAPAMQMAITLALPETGFLRQAQVLAFVPFSKSTLWRRVQEGSFPAPIKLSVRVTAWRAEDIRHWIAQQGLR